MKKLLKILIISSILSIIIIGFSSVFASPIQIPWESSIQKESINITTTWDIQTDINNTWFKLLSTIKVILEWIFIIFIVYAWWQMIMSMWDNEEKLSDSKRQLWYWLIALIFINIPWTLYQAFRKDTYWNIDWLINKWWFSTNSLDWNIFINPLNFWFTFEDHIIWFFKITILASAILMFIIASYKVMLSKWNEEEVWKSKKFFLYWILALIFAGIIDVWKSVIFNWSVSEGINLFSKLANIALFFAWPVAIFFLTLAWYYYITSNWDDEKVKKSKSIVINTVLWTLIILASYSFLLDLANL